ncbi:MAG: HAD-IA family hydrolase [Gammaproteobacteria bacterium]|nr:HAD-IA family hydrolase [Gammaproteobacteria bacterium]
MSGARDIRVVLFDLDGTFADTLPDLRDALGEALAEQGLDGVSADFLRPIVSLGARVMAERACDQRLDEASMKIVLKRFLELYRSNVARHTRLMSGISDLLEALEARGIAWGIVTNKRREWTDPLMRVLDREARAVCIVSGDSTANAKPHPQPLLHACRLAGVPPSSCVYVGDAENDVVAARRAGMRSVAVSYGYIADGDDPRAWGADTIIDAPEDLLAWLDAA